MRGRWIEAVVGWLSAALLVGVAQATEPPPLRIGIVDDAQLAGPTQDVLREAYDRAGQTQLEFVPLPLRRSALMLRQGELDADFMRGQPFFDANPALLRVKVPMRNLVMWVYARPPRPRAVSTETLAGSRVAYQLGTVLVEAQLPAAALRAAATPADVLQRLEAGGADFAVLPMTPGMVSAVERQLPALEAALESMRQDGSLARLWAQGEPSLAAWRATPARPLPRNTGR